MAKKTIQISDFPSGVSNLVVSLSEKSFIHRDLLEGDDTLTVSDPYYPLSGGKFAVNKTYILNFTINYHLINPHEDEKKGEYKGYDFEVFLVNSKGRENQSLKEIFIDPHLLSEEKDGKRNFICIFKPLIDDTFDGISFRLTRNQTDFTGSMRELNIDTVQLMELANLLTNTLYQSAGSNGLTKNFTSIQRIGLQGRPGSLFSIDGEEMKLNKNGIYEITYDNLDIQHIGWVQGDFLLDIAYTYTETKGGN